MKFFYTLYFYKKRREICLKIFTNMTLGRFFALNFAKTCIFSKGAATIVMQFYISDNFSKKKINVFYFREIVEELTTFPLPAIPITKIVKVPKKLNVRIIYENVEKTKQK